MTAAGPPDEALARRAACGDDCAFATIVTRHKGALYRLIRRYVGDADDAYDLLQQTFVAAWQALARFDPERPLAPWLRTIALNKCRDHGRRARFRKLFMIADWSAAERVADVRATPEERWIDDQGLRALDRAIAELPRQLKEPLLLTQIEGLSQAEAGRQLGLSVKAVETRLYRARRRLAVMLNEREGETQ